MLISHRLSTGPTPDATGAPSCSQPTQRPLSRALSSRPPGYPLTRSVAPEKIGDHAKLPPPSGQSKNPSKDAGLSGKPFRPEQPTKAPGPAPAGRRYIALYSGEPDTQNPVPVTLIYCFFIPGMRNRRPLPLKAPPLDPNNLPLQRPRTLLNCIFCPQKAEDPDKGTPCPGTPIH